MSDVALPGLGAAFGRDQGSVLPVELQGVRYEADGAVLLDDITLRFVAGRRTVLMGPNGAGKSLTLRLVQGLIAPTAGRIVYGAGDADATERRRRIAIVFHKPVLLRRSVAGNLRHALRVYGIGRAVRERRIAELLETGGLADLRHRPARVLSSGEQQRLALVRALAAEPELLLLDEPTANLDPHSTARIEGLIERAVAGGTRIVMVTHDAAQARRLADEVVFLHRGRVVEQAPSDLFFDSPRSAAAAAYLAGQLHL